MPRSKQSDRRKLAKLRAEFAAMPWAIDVRSLGLLGNALESGDLDAVRATLSLGNGPESITKLINNVAVIPVTGVLQDECNYMVRFGYASSYQLIERDFLQALDNKQVKGILFYHNSPGGSAIGCKRIADIIFEARGEKPIRSFVQGVCCSADYYIAAAADRIECTADSLVGSVGTILPHTEYSGMLKEYGIGATVITNVDSPKKGHGNMYEPLSEAAKKTLQQFVDSYGRPFINDVARYRALDAEEVIKNFGQGDAMRADVAIGSRMVDAIVANFEESLESISSVGGSSTPVEHDEEPAAPSANIRRSGTMNERIKAQLFALGLIDSLDASEAVCKIALKSWATARGIEPKDEAETLKMLQSSASPLVATLESVAAPLVVEGANAKATPGATTLQAAHNAEQSEARLVDLRAAAATLNEILGAASVTGDMVLDAVEKKLTPQGAMDAWKDILAKKEPPVDAPKITGEGADRYAADVVAALAYKAGCNAIELSNNAEGHLRKPLHAIALDCLRMAGRNDVDAWDDKETIADQAMQMGIPGQRHRFYSEAEGKQYVRASGGPATRPGDFPNIMSGLTNKFLDMIELDEDFSFPEVSAVMPGGLNDFKPALLINKGVVEELDEVQDAEKIKELGLSEEVLSYLFMRRFANKFGWTPVMIANDDLNAFAEGMIGLKQAWQFTQNRLVLDRYTSGELLLDGAALFANRADVGGAANDNDVASGGGVPSDAQWGAMEAKYADIGGIATAKRVRGTLNTWFGPTGIPWQEARRTFMPLNTAGIEPKSADTTANVGIYRGMVRLVPESELRNVSAKVWYGLRSPTRLNTATVIRAYFNGFGTAGRRERWYDPEHKTTWVSLEGRIAAAVKNWRYVVKNKGEN